VTQGIDPLGDRKEGAKELVWKPWQPPVVPLVPSQQLTTGTPDDGGVAPVSRVSSDKNNTGHIAARAFSTVHMEMDINHLAVPLSPAAAATALALGELGTVSAIAQVAGAIAGTPVSPDNLSAALGHFTDHLTLSSTAIGALHGVGEALQVFGGVAGVVAGAVGLKAELDDVRAKGLSPDKALGIAARAAQLVGGVAMALSPLCPPLAAIGASIMTAGSALALGKLAFDHRDDIKRAAKKASDIAGQAATGIRTAADQVTKVISNNGASMSAHAVPGDTAPLRVISNNGGSAPLSTAFQWITG
jgi:hypothetical protein